MSMICEECDKDLDGECECEYEAEPDCIEDHEHAWSDGGYQVHSLGGTTYQSRSQCTHCGIVREHTSHGAQRNPHECDTQTYEEPDGCSKRDVSSWETVDTYVATYPSDAEDGACDVEAQVGRAGGSAYGDGWHGWWYIRTHDDAGGSDDSDDLTAYPTEEAARAAAEGLAAERHEGEDGEDAEAYLDRKTAERAGEPDQDGNWCVYFDTALEDSGPRARYATRKQAEAACEIANKELREANPSSGGTRLLCGYEVRMLEDGEWVDVEDEEDAA